MIIGLDGCRPDALAKASAPRLRALERAGAAAADARCLPNRPTGGDTISGPGWASLLTGVWPNKHRAFDNKFSDNRFAEYPHLFALIRQQRPKAYLASVVSWPPIAKELVSAADENVETADVDEQMTLSAIAVLANRDPDVLFVHFDDIDLAGHEHGFDPAGAHYLAAISGTDARVGRIIDAMRARPRYAQESWLIVAVSDHGGRGKGHAGGAAGPGGDPARLKVPFIVGGSAVATGAIDRPVYNVDLVPTVLTHLGVEIDAKWELDGRAVVVTPRP